MRVQDIITGDEVLSDSYDLKLIDGVAYEADCKKITVGGEAIGRFILLPYWSSFAKTSQTLAATLLLKAATMRALRTAPRPSSTLSTLSVSTRPSSTRSRTSVTSRVSPFLNLYGSLLTPFRLHEEGQGDHEGEGRQRRRRQGL